MSTSLSRARPESSPSAAAPPVTSAAVPPASTPESVRVFGVVSLGHFAIDIFNSMAPVLLAYLRLPLQLSAGQIGFAVGLHQFLAGSTQPLFGWLADRLGSRWLGPGSVAWTVGWLAAAVFIAERSGRFVPFVLLLALAAVGSGAFHPQGTMHAGTAVAGRAATTTAIFFFCGQLGLASGPPLAGLALDSMGALGICLLAAVVTPVPVLMAIGMRREGRAHVAAGVEVAKAYERPAERRSTRPAVLVLLAAIFGLRAWIFIGTAAFLPLLFQGMGWSSTRQGLVTGLFWLGGGLGGVGAGILADRLGRRRLVSVTTGLGALLLVALPKADGGEALLLAVLCGALLGAPHSIMMVICQDLLPVRRGLSSGLALGFLFAMGAVGSWGIGLLADRFELVPVLQAGGGLGLLAAVLSMLLPGSPDSLRADGV